jgi:thiamine biosynthesis protein ThiS
MVRVEGNEIPWREGMTIADLLKELGDPHPYSAVRINGRLVSQPHFSKTRVSKDSEIFLIHLVVGG